MIGTVQGLRDWASVRGLDTVSYTDPFLQTSLEFASARLDDLCRRKLVTDAVASTVSIETNGLYVLAIPECTSVESVQMYGRTLVKNVDYSLVGVASIWGLKRLPAGSVWDANEVVTLSLKLGYLTSVPLAITEAAYMIAAGNSFRSADSNVQTVSVQGVSVTLRESESSILQSLIEPYVRVI